MSVESNPVPISEEPSDAGKGSKTGGNFRDDLKTALILCALLWFLIIGGFMANRFANRVEVSSEEFDRLSTMVKLNQATDLTEEGGGDLTGSRLERVGEDFQLILENGDVIQGYEAVAKYIKETMDPDKFKADFERVFRDYYIDPDHPDFEKRSLEKAEELKHQAEQNLKVMEMVTTLLQSKAGQRVTEILSGNIIKAVNSPAYETIDNGFEAWIRGDRARALQLFEEADKVDSSTHYVQIVAHHAKAFLKTEMKKPLEDIMEEYFELGRESQKYFKNFRPAMEDFGYRADKTYVNGDPFESHKSYPSNERMKEVIRDPWAEIMAHAKPELDRMNEQAQKHIAVLEEFFGKNGEKIAAGNVAMTPGDIPRLLSTIRELEELNKPVIEALIQDRVNNEKPGESTHREEDLAVHRDKVQQQFNSQYNVKESDMKED